MLVLSRKEDQKVRFPELGITVEILRVQGSEVRLGFDAPAEVRIIREELMDGAECRWPARNHLVRFSKEVSHELRNELHSISIALHLLKQGVEAGYVEDFEATFDKLVEHIERINSNQALQSDEALTEQVIAETCAEEKQASTALLVEDQDNEREMLASLLRMHGYQVTTAADGLEALDYLAENEKPEVILVDMRMPRCDGPTTIRRIRENTCFDDVKLFAISGSSPQECGVDLEESGVSHWFRKPLNPKLLLDAMVYVAGTENRSACSIA